MSLRQLIAGSLFSERVLRQMLEDSNFNFKLLDGWTKRQKQNFVNGTFTLVLAGPNTLVVANTAAGSTTINLPTAVGLDGYTLWVKKPSGSNSLTLDPFGVQTIDGATTLVLTAANSTAILVSDDINWLRF